MGTSPKVARAFQAGAKSAFRYPEGPGTLLRRALSKMLGDAGQVVAVWLTEEVHATAGANCSRGTRKGMNDCIAGPENARAAPESASTA